MTVGTLVEEPVSVITGVDVEGPVSVVPALHEEREMLANMRIPRKGARGTPSFFVFITNLFL